MAADIRIRWLLDVVDRGATKDLLKQDRAIRRGLEQTDRQWSRTARTAVGASGQQAQAAGRVATAVRGQGRAAVRASDEVRRYAASQREALTVSSRIVSQSAKVEQAYRRQGRAAIEASRMQQTAAQMQARASRGGAAAAGAAGGLASRAGGLAAAAGLGLGLAAATGQAVGFEKQMANVQARLLTTGANMRKLSDFALELGAKTQFSAGEAAAAMDELAAGGFTVREIFKVLPGTLNLAAASGTDLANAAAIQTATLRGFGLAGDQAGRVADVLAQTANRSAVNMDDLGETLKYVAPVAKATGQSFESMLAAVGLMGNVGIKGSQAGTTLRTSMVRLTNPTDKARTALGKLGIDADKLRGPKGLLPLPQILGQIVKGSQGVEKGTRNAAIATIFGREALSGMVSLIEGGPAKYAAMQRALDNSSGSAKRAADIMRNTVSGAWDNFSGSVETSIVKLTRGFMPALKDALNAAAGGVNKLSGAVPKVAGGIGAGLRGEGVQGRLLRDERGKVTGRADVSQSAQVGQKIGEVARTVGTAAAAAGRQLLDAFKPALPFFQNILLPLLTGIGKGILGSVVMAFKVLVPAIKVVATVLGALGTVAKPLKPVFAGIGTVIGFIAAGPILKLLGGVGKLGVIFRLLAVPIRATAGAFRFLGTGLLGAFRFLARINPAVIAVRLAIAKVPTAIANVVGRAAAAARAVARVIVKGFDVLRSLPGRVFSLIGKIGDRFGGIASTIASRAVKIGTGLIGGVVRGLRQAAGSIGSVISDLAKKAWDKVKGGGVPFVPGIRSGGRVTRSGVRRYQGGGIVDAMVSPGERVLYGGASWMVPGRPTAADSVYARLPVGAAVLTGDGQRRLAAGASLGSAIATQAPHFRKGGVVPGRYTSTAYGPPWGGIQGTGVTKTGVNLRGNPKIYGIAVDPSMIPLGSNVTVSPNPFGRSGSFRAFDIGGAIKGRRIDFYDWRGRKSQNKWGRRPVTVTGAGGGPARSTGGGDATARVPLTLGRSRTRAGLLGDALSQGISAGQEGLTRAEINAALAGRRGARVNPIIAAILGAQTPTTREVTVPGAGDSRSSRGGTFRFRPSGGWAGTEGIVRHAIRGWTGAASYKRGHNTGRGQSDHWTAVKNAFAADIPATGRRGDSIFRTIAGRLGISASKGSWNKFSNKPLRGFRSQLLWHAPDGSHKDHVHLGIRRMRRGGIVGFQGGGHVETPGAGRSLTVAANRLTTFAGGSFAAMDLAIGRAMETKLHALRRALVARVRMGGDKKIVQRLQSAIDLIDFELGRRIGRMLDVVAQRTQSLDLSRGYFDRAARKVGVDPASAAGIQRSIGFTQAVELPGLQANVTTLQRALKAATRTGDQTVIRDITAQLAEAHAAVDEAITSQIERRRDLIRAQAQEALDATSFGVDVAQALQGGIDAGARGLPGGADSPTALLTKAQGIRGQILPALEAQKIALEDQFRAMQSIGDTAGMRQAYVGIINAGNDIMNAMADAADLVRQAALQAAQDVVDTAAHGKTMADLGLQRLELEQRIAGTFEGGGQARADYIKQTLIPTLNAELEAFRAQAAVAAGQGDAKLAQQIAEAIAAKQNDILQATLEATEQTAENTDPRKVGGGTLGFTFGGDVLTDSIVAAGNGA